MNILIIYSILVLLFLFCFVKFEIFLFKKCIHNFKEIQKEYSELKLIKQDLYNLL